MQDGRVLVTSNLSEMENNKFDEILTCMKKISKDGKGLYKDNIIEYCNRIYNINSDDVTKNLEQCIEQKLIKLELNRYGKESYRINKNTSADDKFTDESVQTDVEEDTITFIDSMYEELKYKALKDQLWKDLKTEVINLVGCGAKTTEKVPPENKNLDLEIKRYQQKIISLEEKLAKKDEIIYFLSGNLSNSKLQLHSHTDWYPWILDTPDKK